MNFSANFVTFAFIISIISCIPSAYSSCYNRHVSVYSPSNPSLIVTEFSLAGSTVSPFDMNRNSARWCFDSCGKYELSMGNDEYIWSVFWDTDIIATGSSSLKVYFDVICDVRSSIVTITICENEPNWHIVNPILDCDSAETMGTWTCDAFTSYTFSGKSLNEACCICGGGNHVQVEPTYHPSLRPSLRLPTKPSISRSNEPSLLIQKSLSPSTSPFMCEDEPDWSLSSSRGFQMTCSDITQRAFCAVASSLDNLTGKLINKACCICGGGKHVIIEPRSPTLVPTLKPSQCRNAPDWHTPGPLDESCNTIATHPEFLCGIFLYKWGLHNGKSEYEACCACGGGDHLLSRSSVPSTVPSPSPIVTNVPSIEPSTSFSSSPSTLPTLNPTVSTAPSLQPSTVPSKCLDETDWSLTISGNTLLCTTIVHSSLCELYALLDDNNNSNSNVNTKNVNDACCACGGGVHIISVAPRSSSSSPSAQPSIHEQRTSFSTSTTQISEASNHFVASNHAFFLDLRTISIIINSILIVFIAL